MVKYPHILQKEVITDPERDEFGRIIPRTGGASWTDVCPCRCSDNTTQYFTSENGSVYTPKYKIFCKGHISVTSGESIRVLSGILPIAEGKVYIPKRSNYFNVTALWV
jgi:hypothetical protein